MRNALLISLGFHVALSVIWLRFVRITHVRFVPRQMYSVQLLSMREVDKMLKTQEAVKKEPVAPPIKIEPKPVEKPPEQKKPEELTVPPEKQRKPKQEETRKPAEKEVPSAELRKDPAQSPDAGSPEVPSEQAATGEISLDVEEFPFAYYLMTIRRKIASHWSVPGTSGGDPLYCRVYFRIHRDGSVSSPAIENPSGHFLFDQAAMRAVIQASPMPPLPDGFGDDYLGVHFSFAFEEQ